MIGNASKKKIQKLWKISSPVFTQTYKILYHNKNKFDLQTFFVMHFVQLNKYGWQGQACRLQHKIMV